MSHYAIIPDISNLVDFSPAHHYGPMHWLTAKPRQLPKFTNIIQTFDTACWMLIFFSIIIISLFLVTAKCIGAGYGVQTELTELVLIPYRYFAISTCIAKVARISISFIFYSLSLISYPVLPYPSSLIARSHILFPTSYVSSPLSLKLNEKGIRQTCRHT